MMVDGMDNARPMPLCRDASLRFATGTNIYFFMIMEMEDSWNQRFLLIVFFFFTRFVALCENLRRQHVLSLLFKSLYCTCLSTADSEKRWAPTDWALIPKIRFLAARGWRIWLFLER